MELLVRALKRLLWIVACKQACPLGHDVVVGLLDMSCSSSVVNIMQLTHMCF